MELLIVLKGILLTGLLVQSYVDLRWKLLLDEVNLGLALGGIVYGYYQLGWQQCILGALSFGCLLGGIYLYARGGMGLGDVKLGTALGFWLGVAGSWYCLVLALFLGAVIGGIGLLSGCCNRKTTIPFGPFLSGAALILIWSDASPDTVLLQFLEGW